MKKADVEPDRRIEGAVLMDAEPGQIAVEVFAILSGLEVAIGDAPVGDRAGHSVHKLFDRMLPLRGVDLPVEILADHDVGGQLAPCRGDLTGRLLKQRLAIFTLDHGGSKLPFGGIERAWDVGRAKSRGDFERRAASRTRVGGLTGRRTACERGRVEICHGINSPGERGCGLTPTRQKSILPYSYRANQPET